MEKVKKAQINKAERTEQILEQTKIIAKQLLREIGIKVHILGFKYWLTALIIMQEKARDNKIAMMEIYKLIAKKYRTTATKVERAMRYAYEGLNLEEKFNVDYSINNTALLFLMKEELDKRMYDILKT